MDSQALIVSIVSIVVAVGARWLGIYLTQKEFDRLPANTSCGAPIEHTNRERALLIILGVLVLSEIAWLLW